MPKGNLWKQNLPNGVMKVVSGIDSGDRGICQNPELASNLENIFSTSQLGKDLIYSR